MTEPTEDDDDARTIGILGLLVTFVVPLVGALMCIDSLYRTNRYHGPNRPAIAGLILTLPVLAAQFLLVAWLLAPLR